MQYNKKLVWLFFLVVFVASAQKTQMKIGENPYLMSSPSAVLDLESTTKGFLPPRMTSVSMNSIPSPAQGLVVYCIDCAQAKALYVYNGTSWIPAIAFDATTGSKGVVQLAGDLTGTAASPSIADATVTGKKITGFVSTTGTVSATDNILAAINKLDGNIGLRQTTANLSTNVSTDSTSDTKYPSVKAVKTYVDSTVSSGTPDADANTKGKIQLSGDLTGTAASPSIADATVTGKKITGFASTSGTITATDTVLSAFNKIEGNKSASITQDTGSTVKYPTVKAVEDYVVVATPDATGSVKGKIQLAGDLTGTAASPSIADATVTGKKLTGFASTSGTITATDTVLSAFNKIEGNKSASITQDTGSTIKYPTVKAVEDYVVVAVPDATGSVKGKIQLAGDLTGTAASPSIADETVTGKKITGFSSTQGTVSTTDTILQAIQKLAFNMIPAGVVLPYSGSTLPTGYLWCDGASVSRTTYAALFSAIGTAYGGFDNPTNFNVPDYRGLFLRGRNDFGSGARTGEFADPSGARVLGNIQIDQNRSHKHGIRQRYIANVNSINSYSEGGVKELLYGPYLSTVYNSSSKMTIQTDDFTVGSFVENELMNTSGDAESRPKNMGVNYIIKF